MHDIDYTCSPVAGKRRKLYPGQQLLDARADFQTEQVGNMALRFRARSLIDMVWVQIQPLSCCCALGKGTLRYFPLLGGLTSSSKLQSDVSLLKNKKIKINRTAISRYLRKRVEVITSLCIALPSLSCESGERINR